MTKQFGKKMDDENESMNVWKQNITSRHSKKIIWHATVAVALTLKNCLIIVIQIKYYVSTIYL